MLAKMTSMPVGSTIQTGVPSKFNALYAFIVGVERAFGVKVCVTEKILGGPDSSGEGLTLNACFQVGALKVFEK